MLIDLHAHTSGISRCCRQAAPDILKAAKDTGLDGIVLTNHYYKAYITDGDAASFAKRYAEEFYYTEAVGRDMSLTVLFGIEVTMEKYGGVHMLVYGVTPEFVTEHPDLYDMTLPQLHGAVSAVGGVLVQAHPLRREKNVLLDTAYLEGVEVNSHPIYGYSHLKEMWEVAERDGLILTSGGDYHADTPYRPSCGTYLPDGTDTLGLARFLKEAEKIRLRVHEPGEADAFEVEFSRNKKEK